MSRTLKAPELDALPVRDGGPDMVHDHLSLGYDENCGACAQLKNDFTWARFHDAVDPSLWVPAPPVPISLAG